MGFDNYIITREENSLRCYGFKDDEVNRLFRNASEAICFADCTDIVIEEIVVNGRRVEYVGWQPDMLFSYLDVETGDTIWEKSYPNWEH